MGIGRSDPNAPTASSTHGGRSGVWSAEHVIWRMLYNTPSGQNTVQGSTVLGPDSIMR